MGEQNNYDNDPRTGESGNAQNAGNMTSGEGRQQDQSMAGQRNEGTPGMSQLGQTDGSGYGSNDGNSGESGGFGQQNQSGAGYGDQGMSGQGGFPNDDESRGGPPTGENLDDTGGLTSDHGARTGQGGMQQDALGAASGSEMNDDDLLEDQNSSGAV